MITSIDEIKGKSWIFRVFTETNSRPHLNASCVIEEVDQDLCKIHILNIVDGITMQELRPKIKAKVMAAGFTDYTFSRSYNKAFINRKVR